MRKRLCMILIVTGILSFFMPAGKAWAKESIFYFSEETRKEYTQQEIVIISQKSDFSSWHTSDSFPLVKEVRIEEGTEKINGYIFKFFPNVEKIVLPQSLKDIGNAFYPYEYGKEIKPEDYCLRKLKTIEVSKNNRNFICKDGALYTRDYMGLLYYPSGNQKTVYNMPEFTKWIQRQAFGYNEAIVKIVLGTRFVWGSGEEFSEYGTMPNLNEIGAAPDNAMLSSEGGVLFDAQKSTLLRYPEGKEVKAYTVPDTVTNLETQCFAKAKIGKLILPKGLHYDLYMYDIFYQNQIGEFSISGNKVLSVEDGVLYNKERTQMVAWPGAKQVKTLSFPTTLVTLDLRKTNIPCVKSVTKLVIPTDTVDIWIDEGQNSLSTIEVAGESKNYCVYDGLLYTKDLTLLIMIPCKLQKNTITIPAQCNGFIDSGILGGELNSVRSVTVKGSGKYFPYQIFPNLANIEVAKGNKKAASIDGVLYSPTKKTLIWYPQAKKDTSFTVPDTVIAFSYDTFSIQHYIKTITLSKKLNLSEFSGTKWFYDCPKLEEIKVPSENPYLAGKDDILYSKEYTDIICYPQAKNETDYYMPETVKQFHICSGNEYLTLISFGKSFERFDYIDWSTQQSLMQFKKLGKLMVSEKNQNMFVTDDVLYEKIDNTWNMLVYPSGLTRETFTIPDEVTECWDVQYAFLKHPYLKEIRWNNPNYHIFGMEIFNNYMLY